MSAVLKRSPEERIERWIRFGVLFVVALVSFWFFHQLRAILLPFLVSVIAAYLLNPLVQVFEARAVRREIAVAALTFIFTFIAVMVIVWATPVVVQELGRLRHALPTEIVSAKLTLMRVEEQLAEQYPFLAGYKFIEKITTKAETAIAGFGTAAPDWVLAHSTSLIMTILIPFFVFFLLRDGERWIDGMFNALPHRQVETVMGLIREFNASLGGYMRSLVIDAIVVGTLVAAGLLGVGLDYALIIGFITGIGNLVPYLGPVLGWGIATVAAIFQGGDSSWLIVQVAVVFGIVKVFDDWLFQPLIVGHGAHVHPVLVVLSVFIGGHALGIVGMVIAVPVTVVIQVALSIAFERYRFASDPMRARSLPPERVIL